MDTRRTSRLLLTAIILSSLLYLPGAGQGRKTGGRLVVYKFNIDEQIAAPVWRKTQKAFETARTMNADIVLIHMNTYGGTLEAADSIRTAILKSPIPVYVFIDNNAASAGALISIACDSIYMHPGASIGAATVVDQSGKPLPDKYQSYMRSMMRSTAETTGRDPNIAQAMVDPRIRLEGIKDTGLVLTFTATEAMRHGFCEGIATTVGEVMDNAGISDYEVEEQKLTGMDKFIGFLINPIVSGLLIMIIIGGIYFELQTPGIGFPLAAAVVAALLYFAPHYLEGLANHWEILLFIAGVIMVVVELFAFPGFGFLGIAGIVVMVLGLSLSMINNVGFSFTKVELGSLAKALLIVTAAMFISITASFFLARKMFSAGLLSHLALHTTQDTAQGFTSSDLLYKNMIGKTGTARTILRPAGKVEIEQEIFDATAVTGYIDKGCAVRVVGYQTGQLTVEKLT